MEKKLAELGRTEYIMNDANPEFKKTIALKYDPDADQQLRFRIFDTDAILSNGEVRDRSFTRNLRLITTCDFRR